MKIASVSGDDFLGDDPLQLRAALASRGHEAISYARRRCPGSGSEPSRTRSAADGNRTAPLRVGPRTATAVPDMLPCAGARALPCAGEWAAALERVWSSDQPDVVHAYGWLGGLAALLAARRQRRATVQTFLGLAAKTSPCGAGAAGRVEPLVVRSATWVTGECTTDVDALVRIRRSRTRLSALTIGVDVERYSPVGPAHARTDLPRVLCLVPNPLSCNGLGTVVKATPKVPAAELVIAETEDAPRGHDQARAGLQRLAAGLGLTDRVRFPGTMADADLPTLVRSVDVVACTPRWPPRAATVGTALRSLLAQTFQCESMRAAGRSRALSRFSWDRIAPDSPTIYRQVGICRQVGSQRSAPPESPPTVTP